MKKRNKIMGFYVLLALSALILSGCGSKSATASAGGAGEKNSSKGAATKAVADSKSSAGEKTTGTQTTKAAAQVQMEGNLYLTGLPIVKKPETFTIAVIVHPLDKGKYEDKPAVIQAEKDTNIKIKWMEIPSTGWGEKINVIFASGELPDAIIQGVSDSTIIKNLPQLVPIGDYLAKYAPHVEKVYDETPELKTWLKQKDGKIYTCMTNAQSSRGDSTSGVLFINKQWLDKLGLPLPTTMDEYYEDLKAFKEKDPNGDGKADEIPLSFCQQSWSTQFHMLMGSFGIQDDSSHIMIEDGKVEFSPAKPEYYEGLKYYHKLMAEGLLDQEGFSQSLQQYYSKGRQMAIGSFLGFLPFYVVGDENSSQYVPLAPLKPSKGKPLWDGIKDGFIGRHGGFLITKACKHPEALLRWFDYANTDFTTKMEWYYGDRGVLWDMDDSTGQWWETLNLPKGITNKGEYRYTVSAGPNGPAFITKDDLSKKITKNDPLVNARLACIDLVEPYFPKASDTMGHMFEDEKITEEKSNLSTDIDNYVKNFTAQAVLSGIDDAGWQEHLAKLKKLNVDRYVALMQETYDKQAQ